MGGKISWRNITLTLLVMMVSACGGGQPHEDSTERRAFFGMSATAGILEVADNSTDFSILRSNVDIAIVNRATAEKLSHFDATIQRVRFADTSVAFDITGVAGKIYRLYQAAFGRVPDGIGLGFWISAMDNGASLEDIANGFIQSQEFTHVYGVNPSNEVFLRKLYENVLHRPADQGGFQFWLGLLAQGQTRAKVLVAFAESDENKTILLPAIVNGIFYTEQKISYRPVAQVSGPKTGIVGAVMAVDGSASSDANGDMLQYRWQIIQKPTTSKAVFSSETARVSSFIPDVAGSYDVSLVVSDSALNISKPIAYRVNVFDGGVVPIADTGRFVCANLGAADALSLYFAGHTYLDRDNDGKPCEVNDKQWELAHVPPVVVPPVVVPPVVIPPVVVPPVVTPPSTGRTCYVNGYYRKNGTYVRGYYRAC